MKITSNFNFITNMTLTVQILEINNEPWDQMRVVVILLIRP